ncbi:MAG: hypothetical protein F9K16_15500 [Thermoanaerobaculia bacterium]|nr:MAG: hypothetical protein F9K16_15500 [Thermoanaerobaculia bacterium]
MEGWEVVRTLGNEEEASLVAGFLESRGVRTSVESLLFHQEPVNFGRLGEVRVLVPEADAETARALLEEMAAGGAAGEAEPGEEGRS